MISFYQKSILWYCVPLLMSAKMLQAQDPKAYLAGTVKNQQGVPIPGASLYLKGKKQGASTDSLGRFSIAMPANVKQVLYCYSIGYRTDSISVSENGNGLAEFILAEEKNELNGINIVSERRKLSDLPKTYTLNEFDIVTTAGATGDVAAALQTFPGASAAGNETGIFIHGGAAGETQAFFDGMMVKNAFGSRLPDIANRSRFSAFLFDRTAFSTSGYSPEYGQGLSSVFTMDTKGIPATSSDEFSIISLGLGAAHTERFKNSSLMLGGNYYNFGPNNSLIPQNTKWLHDPVQYQVSTHYKLATSSGGIFKFYADYSDTRLSFDIDNPTSSGMDLLDNRNRNLYLNAVYRSYLGRGWKFFSGAAYNRTLESGEVNRTGYFQRDDLLHAKLFFTKVFSNRSLLSMGAEEVLNDRSEGYGALVRGYQDALHVGFVTSEIYFSKLLMLKAGLRSEYSAYLQRLNTAPRVALIIGTGLHNQFSINYGLYYQKPDDSFLSQYALADYEKAINLSLLYELKIKNRNLKVELFHKDYKNLTKIQTSVFSGFQAYGPPVNILSVDNMGSGYSRGLDIFWRDQSLTVGEYYVSYSFLDTKRNYIDYPVSARPPFAPRHTLNIVGRKFLPNSGFQLSGTYTFSSGRTYFNPGSGRFLSDKTADFHNLSLALSYLPKWIKPFAALSVNFSNVLGFKQVYGYRFSYDGSRSHEILPPSRRGVLLSFLMNFGDGQFNH